MRPLRLSPALLLAAVLVVAALPGTASADGLPARAREAYRAYLAGDLDRADAVSAQAVKESARSGGAWAVRGYVLSKRGDKGGAAIAYRRAVLFDPTSEGGRGDRVRRANACPDVLRLPEEPRMKPFGLPSRKSK